MMENRIKYVLSFLIIFAIVPKADAQTSEIDTIFYYDRTTGDFLFWIDTCLSPGYCQPIAVGFDLSPEHSYTLTELRMSFYAQGKYPYSIHKGIEWPSDSNEIYQDTIIVQRSERDSIGDSLIVYKSIMFEDIPELNNLIGKFWVVIDIKTYSLAITDGDHDIFSTHSFYKFITDASWDSVHGEWVIDAITEKRTIGIKPDSSPELVSGYNLIRSYPNPFNSITTITYEILHSGFVKLMLYDVRGREIIHLYDGYTDSGKHELTWNGSDRDGKEVSSGIYIATLSLNNELIKSMKLMLIK